MVLRTFTVITSYSIHYTKLYDMWRKIAAQSEDFGHPDKFCYDPEQTNWMSATVTLLDDKVVPYIKNICKRDPYSGKVRNNFV